MRKILLLQLLLGLFCVSLSNAQNITLLGPRLFVNSPSSIGGLKTFTYSSPYTGNQATSNWGRALDSFWNNVELVKAVDSLACGPLTNDVTDKWVLIYRGTCMFSEKAFSAQNKGAKGVIIVNNVAGGEAVGMAKGNQGDNVNIPVLMVSNADGNAINAVLNGGQQVFISLTRWGFNNDNDLAFVPNSIAQGPGAIPLNQWKEGSPDAYKFFMGAFIANVGNNDQTNVKVRSVLSFTPTGGSASVVYTDSVETATFAAADSIIEVLSPRAKSVNPTQTGRYTMTYTIEYDNADDNVNDNTQSYSLDVTNNIFSKARLDANGNPMVTQGLQQTGTAGYVWGPLFFINKGNYVAKALKYAISDGDTTKHALTGDAVAYMFKWVDGSGGGTVDNFIQPSELSLKGAAVKQFTNSDSNHQVFSVPIGDDLGLPAEIVTEDNSWYWFIADMPSTAFLGVDDKVNYFNRSNAAKRLTPSILDFWAPFSANAKDAMLSAGANAVRMLPFGTLAGGPSNIDSMAFSSGDAVPSMALELSPYTVSVKNTVQQALGTISLFPNPATDKLNIAISLSKAATSQVRIIDAMGKKLYQADVDYNKETNVSIDTRAYAPGNYYVVIVSDGRAMFQPFTVAGK